MKKNQTRPLYLKSLSLKNFATFDDSFINFDPCFNVIAGETGSGKSLILDALCLILGQRADKKQIRKGNDFLIIEAVFHCHDEEISSFFDEMGFPITDNELIVKRIVYNNGKSKNYINFGQCNLTDLVTFSKRFIDIVGQFENQKLLSEKYQLILIDKFGGIASKLSKYQSIYAQYKEVNTRIKSLGQKQDSLNKELNYVNYQLDELNALAPDIEEEKKLIEKKHYIINFEKRLELVYKLQDLLNTENGILDTYAIVYKLAYNNESLLPEINFDDLSLIKEKLDELQSSLQSETNFEFDEADSELIIDRLDQYQKLKAKHKTDTKGLLKLQNELMLKKDALLNSELSFENLKQDKDKLLTLLIDTSEILHQSRLKIANKLSKELSKSLQALNMIGSTLKIEITKADTFNDLGRNNVKIIAETNRGEGFYEIKKIASGGELSRILLAFRQVLSSKDTISIFLFDEIDTGIGGETALKIGKSLKDVSNSSQVVAITHLPQIASYSTKVLNVLKQYSKDQERTFSLVEEIMSSKEIMNFSKSMSPISQELQ